MQSFWNGWQNIHQSDENVAVWCVGPVIAVGLEKPRWLENRKGHIVHNQSQKCAFWSLRADRATPYAFLWFRSNRCCLFLDFAVRFFFENTSKTGENCGMYNKWSCNLLVRLVLLYCCCCSQLSFVLFTCPKKTVWWILVNQSNVRERMDSNRKKLDGSSSVCTSRPSCLLCSLVGSPSSIYREYCADFALIFHMPTYRCQFPTWPGKLTTHTNPLKDSVNRQLN